MFRGVPAPSGRDLGASAALAAVAVAGTAAAAAAQGRPWPGPWVLAAVVAAAAAWAWHRVAPVPAAVVVVVLAAAYVVAGAPYGPIQALAALACFSLARRTPVGVAGPVGGAATVVLAVALWTRLEATDLVATATVLVAWTGVFVVVPTLAGALVRAGALSAERTRAEWLARGADEERLRVAREVHDIAGHGFAVVAMQAGVALTVFEEDARQARICLEAIRATSEHALRELHGSLDALGIDAPTVTDVPALIERVRAGGLAVDLLETGTPVDVSHEASATVYRLVQEALTNVVRHAAVGSASVTLAHDPSGVSVRVGDRGAGSGCGPDAASAGGRGLAGLRERVTGLGGTFAAGDDPAGGFEVRAFLPSQGRPR